MAGSLKHAAIFNLEGEKLEEVKLQQVLDETSILEGGNGFRIKSVISGNSSQYLGFLTDWSAKFMQLMKVYMSNSTLSKLDLAAFDKLEEYNVARVSDGEIIGFLGFQVLIHSGGDKIVISNNERNL